MRFGFGPYRPDLAQVGVNQLRTALNVIPLNVRNDDPNFRLDYGPINGLNEFTDALSGGECRGAFATLQADATVQVFAGTVSTLETYTSGNTFSDVSKGGGYSTGTDENWHFAQYQDKVIATNWDGAIQTWTLGTSANFADLSADAPRARYVAVWRDFVVAANTYDATDGNRPWRVWWPQNGDPTNWPTPGTAAAEAAESDFRDLPEGSHIKGIVGAVGGADGAVISQRSVFRADYQGPPTVFAIDRVEASKGTEHANSIVPVSDIVFYLGTDGFYAFDGVRSVPIGTLKVDTTFFNKLSQNRKESVWGAADLQKKHVYWLYPSSDSITTPDKVIIYNYEVGEWSEAEVDATLLASIFVPSYTLDQLDGFGTLDALPLSLDSSFWLGGSPVLIAVTDNHKLAYFTGSTLEASLETGDWTQEGARRTFVTGIHPIIDSTATQARVGTADEQTKDDGGVTWGAYTSKGVDQVCPQRADGLFCRFGFKVPAGETWEHASGADVDLQDAGAR